MSPSSSKALSKAPPAGWARLFPQESHHLQVALTSLTAGGCVEVKDGGESPVCVVTDAGHCLERISSCQTHEESPPGLIWLLYEDYVRHQRLALILDQHPSAPHLQGLVQCRYQASMASPVELRTGAHRLECETCPAGCSWLSGSRSVPPL